MAISVIGTNGIEDGAIVAADIASGAVTQAKLGTNVTGTGPAFNAYTTTIQNVTSNTITKITLDTELFDTNNNFASSRFTPTVAGYYQFSYSVKGSANANTVQAVNAQITKNGNEPIQTYLTGSYVYSTAVNEADSTGSILLYMNGSTDYVELYGKILGTSPYFVGAYLSGFLARAA